MTANEYQTLALTKQADQDAIRIRLYALGPKATQMINACRGLAEEAGECQNPAKKWLEYGRDLDRQRCLDEAGDVLWRLAQYLDAVGFTLEEAMAANLRKLDVRHDGGFSSHHAADENRDRAAEAAAVAGQVTVAEQRQIQQAVYGPAAEAARQERARVAVQQGRRILQEQARRPSNVGPQCTAAPAGWQCHRTEGHDGPCAATRTVPGGERPEDPA